MTLGGTPSTRDLSNNLVPIRDTALNENGMVSWCRSKICSGIIFVASTTAQHQTTVLVSSVAIITLSSLVGILPRNYSISVLKQSAFQFASSGCVYGVLKIWKALSKTTANEAVTKFETNHVKPMSQQYVYNLPPLFNCLLSPIEEELTYRVALYALTRRFFSFVGMQNSTADSTAVLSSSLIFAGMHTPRVKGLLPKIETAVGPFLNSYFMLFPAYLSGGYKNAILVHVVHNLQSYKMLKYTTKFCQNNLEQSSQQAPGVADIQ
jgi:hypothetical protein